MPRDPAAKAVAPLLPVETALDRILQGLGPQAAASVPLADASGRILADNIAATVSLPAHDLSAMDGYAVKSADCQPGAPLTRIGESAAGHPFASQLAAREAVRIFTGAVIPDGADAILLQEDAEAPPGVESV